MASDKIQVVFVADTALPQSGGISQTQYCRSLCLATLRILLYLSQFPIREHLKRVLWNFKLFSSKHLQRSTKSWQFNENRSELIEKFFQKLHEALFPVDSPRHSKSRTVGSQKPVKLVYNALATVVQDFVWDAPEIMSPIRPRKRGRAVRSQAAASNTKPDVKDCDKNIVIILSSCPTSETDLRRFCYGSEVNRCTISMATVREQLLPPALLTQLSTKGIAVHWVHTGALAETGDTLVSGWKF